MRRALFTTVASLALATLLAACPKETKEAPKPAIDAGAAAATTATTFDGPAVIRGACLSCHTEEMLEQQRLTQAQWTKVVTKMVTWGSTLEAGEVTPLIAYLSEKYGPDAGTYELATVPAAEALAELAPTDDGAIPKGDPEKGKPLYVDKCSGCHGADARGNVGVNLVERPALYRAADFATLVRRGKGKMTPTALDDAQIGDILAHLRRLRIPPP